MVLAAYKLLEQIVVESALLEEYKYRYRSKPNSEHYLIQLKHSIGGTMKNHPVPAIGKWYLDNADHQLFEIVAIDEEDDTIEIQYFDGSIEELDSELWNEMELTSAAPPEDWSGPFDDLEADDMPDPDNPVETHEFGQYIDQI